MWRELENLRLYVRDRRIVSTVPGSGSPVDGCPCVFSFSSCLGGTLSRSRWDPPYPSGEEEHTGGGTTGVVIEKLVSLVFPGRPRIRQSSLLRFGGSRSDNSLFVLTRTGHRLINGYNPIKGPWTHGPDRQSYKNGVYVKTFHRFKGNITMGDENS